MSLRTPRSQLLRGPRGFLLQPGSDVVPASISSTDSWRISCAGVPSGRCLTCPSKDSQPPVSDDCAYVWQTCLIGDWWVCHEVWPRMRHWYCMWRFATDCRCMCQLREEESTEHRKCLTSTLCLVLDEFISRHCRFFQLGLLKVLCQIALRSAPILN